MPRSTPRAAHWVIRCSGLRPANTFFREVLGLVTIRHEENSEPCKITCNGRYNNAWSKTMVGAPQHYEDEWYCLEVTYNYGLLSYQADNALLSFGVGVEDVPQSVKRATELGYAVEFGPTVVGPDGYRYDLYPKLRPEPFLYVMLRVGSLAAGRSFYCGKLGMLDVTNATLAAPYGLRLPRSEHVQVAAVAYDDGWRVPNILVADGVAPMWTSWSGRFAVSTPSQTISEIYSSLDKEKNVVHELDELGSDKLGKLFIAIIKDDDGYETCLVSSEFFDKATRSETTWQEPDWDQRRAFIDERAKPSDKGESS